MPTRDETGKRIGGAETKRRAAENAGPALDFSSLFAELPPPPIGNPIGAMLWCNDALLLCMNAFMRQAAITPAELTRLRLIMDGCAKAGMIRDKSAESKAMQEALRKKAQKQEAAGLEPNAHRSDPPTIPRPAG
jgi:hypothetical protein